MTKYDLRKIFGIKMDKDTFFSYVAIVVEIIICIIIFVTFVIIPSIR